VAIDPLLLEFASSRPAELAELMVDADGGELEDLISRLPVKAAARVAACLPSWILSQLLVNLSPSVTAELLWGARHDDAVTLVAHLHEIQYADILESSKPDQLDKLHRLFEFPTLSLSALASPEFIRVEQSQLCASFIEELSAYNNFQSRPIFAVDAQGVYRGVVNLFALIAKDVQQQKVARVTEYIRPLSGEMSAAMGLESPLWLNQLALPVTDRKGRVLGAVTRRQLLGLVQEERPGERGLELVIPELATAYLGFCADILKSVCLRGSK
jgi:Mg/Co/Ni transporter MgtE